MNKKTACVRDNDVKQQLVLDIKAMGEIAGIFSACIAIITVLGLLISRLVSLGRALYFEFDIPHYRFVADTFSWLVVLMILFAAVLGTLIALGIYKYTKPIIALLIDHFQPICSLCSLRSALISTVKIVVFAFLLFGYYPVLHFVITRFVEQISGMGLIFVMVNTLVMFSSMAWGALLIGSLIFKEPLSRLKLICLSSCVLLIFSILIVVAGMVTTYQSAEAQKAFAIVQDLQPNGSTNYYAIVSTDKEQYSAYLCEIDVAANTLTIKPYQHKYFDKFSVHTTNVLFAKIYYDFDGGGSEAMNSNEYGIAPQKLFGQ